MEYVLRPFVYIDGVPTLKDSEIKDLFERLVRDGTDKSVFYDGLVKDPEGFLGLVLDMKNVLFFTCHRRVERLSKPVGMVWLNHFEGRMARIHFAIFKEAWGDETLGIARFALREMFSLKGPSGKPMFEVFVGIIIAQNTRAVAFVKELGFKIMGNIPAACWDSAAKKAMPGTLVHIERR